MLGNYQTRNSNHVAYLEHLGACKEGFEFARKFDSLQDAWTECTRGDWMLWLYSNMTVQFSSNYRDIVNLSCKCSRLSLCYIFSEYAVLLSGFLSLADEYVAGRISEDDLTRDISEVEFLITRSSGCIKYAAYSVFYSILASVKPLDAFNSACYAARAIAYVMAEIDADNAYKKSFKNNKDIRKADKDYMFAYEQTTNAKFYSVLRDCALIIKKEIPYI